MAITGTRLLDHSRHKVVCLKSISHRLFKFPLQAVGLAQASQVEINQRFLIAGMVTELAVIVLTGLQQLQGCLQQAPLCLAFASAIPDCMGMALEHRPHLIGSLVGQGLHGALQASTLLEGEGVSLAKVCEMCARCGKVEFSLDGFSTFDIGRYRSVGCAGHYAVAHTSLPLGAVLSPVRKAHWSAPQEELQADQRQTH